MKIYKKFSIALTFCGMFLISTQDTSYASDYRQACQQKGMRNYNDFKIIKKKNMSSVFDQWDNLIVGPCLELQREGGNIISHFFYAEESSSDSRYYVQIRGTVYKAICIDQYNFVKAINLSHVVNRRDKVPYREPTERLNSEIGNEEYRELYQIYMELDELFEQ